jgi:hypothetical protein
MAPNIDHVGLVYNPEPGNNSAAFRKSIDEVADSVGIASIETPSGDASDIDRLIRLFKDKPKSGLIFLPDAVTSTRPDYFTALVAQSRLPAIYTLRIYCEAGGLISYGVKFEKIVAAAASYVDRILRGADPAELPVTGSNGIGIDPQPNGGEATRPAAATRVARSRRRGDRIEVLAAMQEFALGTNRTSWARRGCPLIGEDRKSSPAEQRQTDAFDPKRLRGSYLILAKHSFRRSSSERTCETSAFCSAAVPLLKNSPEAFLSRFCCQSRIAVLVAFWASDVDLTYVAMQASADEHIGHS